MSEPDKLSPSERTPARKTTKSHSAREPEQRFRVEGTARRGRIIYITVVGRAGVWHMYGPKEFRLEIRAKSIEAALKIAGRRLPLRPVAIRAI